MQGRWANRERHPPYRALPPTLYVQQAAADPPSSSYHACMMSTAVRSA
jgi:hypothetical protein